MTAELKSRSPDTWKHDGPNLFATANGRNAVAHALKEKSEKAAIAGEAALENAKRRIEVLWNTVQEKEKTITDQYAAIAELQNAN